MAGDSTASEQRPGYVRALVDPPQQLVENGKAVLGCFTAPVPRVNLLDLDFASPIPRWIKAFRCKEWRAFQGGDSRWFFFSALYEAKALGLSIFCAWDKKEKRSVEMRHILPLKNFGIGENLDGESAGYHNRHSAIRYTTSLSEGTIVLEASRSRRGKTPGFAAALNFAYNARQTAPSAVCLPLGLNRVMYSAKVLMPMQGWFEIGDEHFEFSAPDAMGILDDHKGYYPYTMRYDWVSGFGTDAKGRRVGFNLTDNQVRNQALYNENVLWINGKVFPLPPIKVTRPQGVAGVWHIQDTEGLVDLAFKPQKQNDVKFNLLVAQTDYHGPFGSFEGLLRSPDGEKVDVGGLFGMGEQKYLRV